MALSGSINREESKGKKKNEKERRGKEMEGAGHKE